MSSALRLTGTAPSFNIFSSDPEYVGRTRIDSYIPGLWMTVTSNIAAKTAIHPGQPPVEPKKPKAPAASQPVEPVAPRAPKAPIRPVEPTKPAIPEPQKPDLKPVTPPTPPTPKLVKKPNEPVDTAGEKPKEPKVPRVEKPNNPTDNVGTPPVKPTKPTPVAPVNTSINVKKVTVERITNWVTLDGVPLKSRVVDKDFKPKENFDGYEFVETKVEGNVTTHIYQQKQTRWITTDGKVLKNPVVDKDFKPKENFEGYEFVETNVDGNDTVHVYKQKQEPVTRWVDVNGNVLKDVQKGALPDKEGDDIPNYTFVRTDIDKDGNVTNVYQQVTKPKAKELPNTGDASLMASIIGLGLTSLGVTTLARRKR